MELSISVEENKLFYTAKSIPDKYVSIFDHWFFTVNENHGIKEYEINSFMFTHNPDKLQNNYNSNISIMLRQAEKIDKPEWKESLTTIIKLMEKHNIKWWLTGSAACAIRGIDIIPTDLDIMTYCTEADRIKLAFEEYIIEPFHKISDWIVKGFGIIFLGMRIDFAFDPEKQSDSNGELDCGYFASRNLETITWNGCNIKVPPLHLHLKSNIDRNRMDRVELIEQMLNAK